MPCIAREIRLGKPRSLDDFYWGLTIGSFLFRWGVLKTLWGKVGFCLKKFRSFGCLPLYWELSLAGETQELAVIWSDSRFLNNLLGNLEKLGDFYQGLVN